MPHNLHVSNHPHPNQHPYNFVRIFTLGDRWGRILVEILVENVENKTVLARQAGTTGRTTSQRTRRAPSPRSRDTLSTRHLVGLTLSPLQFRSSGRHKLVAP